MEIEVGQDRRRDESTASIPDNTRGGTLISRFNWKRPKTPELEELYRVASRMDIEAGHWSPYSLVQNTGISVYEASRAMISRNESFFIDNKFKSFSTFQARISYLQAQCPPGMYYLYGRQHSRVWKLSKRKWRTFSPRDWHFGAILQKKTRNSGSLHVGIDGNGGFGIWSFPFSESILKKFFSDLYYGYFFADEKFTDEKIVAMRKELEQLEKKRKWELKRKQSKDCRKYRSGKEVKSDLGTENEAVPGKIRKKRKRRHQRRRRNAQKKQTKKQSKLPAKRIKELRKKIEVIDISFDDKDAHHQENSYNSDDEVIITENGNDIIIID